MRLFIYKCIVVFVGIYLTYNFTIGKKIDEYENQMKYFITDQGREQFRNFIRKELKNSLDNENLLDIEDRVLIKRFIEKLNQELN
tara:strand:+ start:13 stop:267 length:255 start_codon:yes stop_codon:yes gene_type:complete